MNWFSWQRAPSNQVNPIWVQVQRNSTPVVKNNPVGLLWKLLSQVHNIWKQKRMNSTNWKIIEDAINIAKKQLNFNNSLSKKDKQIAYNVIFTGNQILSTHNTKRNIRSIEVSPNTKFDIIIIAGQSNTHWWEWYDPRIHKMSSQALNNTFQLNALNKKIERSTWGPFAHHTFKSNMVWPWLAIANNYKLRPWRKLLIIPLWHWSTGKKEWQKGWRLYKDMVAKLKQVHKNFPWSDFKWLYWSQWEESVKNNMTKRQYANFLDGMINWLKNEVPDNNFKLITTWLDPDWIKTRSNPQVAQWIHEATVEVTKRHNWTVLPINAHSLAVDGHLHTTVIGQFERWDLAAQIFNWKKIS